MNILLLKIKSGAILLALLAPAWAAAQLSNPTNVLGNGSTPASNAQWKIKSTIAQPLIGSTTSSANQQLIGFWYQPKALIISIEKVSLDGRFDDFHLGQNFPNPAYTYTKILFSVPSESFVDLILMDSSGKVMRRLANGNFQNGQYQVEVEVSQLPVGTYLYQLYVDNRLAGSRKMVVGR